MIYPLRTCGARPPARGTMQNVSLMTLMTLMTLLKTLWKTMCKNSGQRVESEGKMWIKNRGWREQNYTHKFTQIYQFSTGFFHQFSPFFKKFFYPIFTFHIVWINRALYAYTTNDKHWKIDKLPPAAPLPRPVDSIGDNWGQNVDN